MHPLLARYLNFDQAIDTLQRQNQGQVLKAEEQYFIRAAQKHAEHREKIWSSRGKTPSESTQAALLILATHAALHAVSDDEQSRPLLGEAAKALTEQGADEEEAAHMLGMTLVEEAFGYEDEADSFDQSFFNETLATIPALAGLTHERVSQLYEAFIRTAPPEMRPSYEVAAQSLLEAAWQEGPEPINPEHVEEALARIRKKSSPGGFAQGASALKSFLEFQNKAQFIGKLRLERLKKKLDLSAATSRQNLN